MTVVTDGARVGVVARDPDTVQIRAVDVTVTVVIETVGAVLGAIAREVAHAGEVDEGHTPAVAVARHRVGQRLACAMVEHALGDGRVRGRDGFDGALARAVTPDTQRLLGCVLPTFRGRVGVPAAVHAGGGEGDEEQREQRRVRNQLGVGQAVQQGTMRHEFVLRGDALMNRDSRRHRVATISPEPYGSGFRHSLLRGCGIVKRAPLQSGALHRVCW